MLDESLRALFSGISPSTHYSLYNGPWNALLNKCFPFEEGFMVLPIGPVADGRDRVDYPVQAFTVKRIQEAKAHDVFILEVSNLEELDLASKRKAADIRVRRRFGDAENISGTLHAASAFGTKLRLYEKDGESGMIAPPKGHPCEEFEKDSCPKADWNVDILEETGFQMFVEHAMRRSD